MTRFHPFIFRTADHFCYPSHPSLPSPTTHPSEKILDFRDLAFVKVWTLSRFMHQGPGVTKEILPPASVSHPVTLSERQEVPYSGGEMLHFRFFTIFQGGADKPSVQIHFSAIRQNYLFIRFIVLINRKINNILLLPHSCHMGLTLMNANTPYYILFSFFYE